MIYYTHTWLIIERGIPSWCDKVRHEIERCQADALLTTMLGGCENKKLSLKNKKQETKMVAKSMGPAVLAKLDDLPNHFQHP